MLYQKFKPHHLLSPYVECYFVWEFNTNMKTPIFIESPPSGFGSMVFNYANPYHIQNEKYEALSVPASFIGGQSIMRYHLKLKGNIGMAGVVFKPSGLASLFNLPMHEFVEERYAADDVLGQEVAFIHEKVALAKTVFGKVQAIENFLLQQIKEKDIIPDPLDYCCLKIMHQNGIVNVSNLLEEVFMSRRQFERRFLRKVGLSPKYYARIFRLSKVCWDLISSEERNFQSIIGRGQYFDQSHFIKDFQEFMNIAPAEYYRQNTELSNFLASN